jgi:multidrug efflux pump subunit AcrB
MKIDLLFDQSVFVSNAIQGVLQEGAIAAGLTALMMLIFLGSWRSMLVVMVAIPLSIMTSIAVLAALGQTINTMTLGGLALAVGILVDDSTVTIENTHRLLEEGTEFEEAVLEGAAGIAVPTLISTLAICSVFVSVFFLQGAARYLFTPLAMAVVFAMLASHGISRTLTPIMIGLLLRKEHERRNIETGWLSRFHAGFNARFDRFRNFYGWLLAGILRRSAGASCSSSSGPTSFPVSMRASFNCMSVPLPAPALSAPNKYSRRSRTISAKRSRLRICT